MHYGPTAAIEVLTDLPPTPSLRPARPTPSLRRGQSAHCSLLTVPYALLISHWRALPTVPYALLSTYWRSLLTAHHSLLITHSRLQVEVRAGAESFGKGNRRRMRFGALLRKARRPLLTCAHLASAVPTCLRTVRAWGAGPLVQGPPCCSTGRSSGAAPLGQGLEPRAEPGVLLSAPWHHHRWRRVRRNTI